MLRNLGEETRFVLNFFFDGKHKLVAPWDGVNGVLGIKVSGMRVGEIRKRLRTLIFLPAREDTFPTGLPRKRRGATNALLPSVLKKQPS